MGSARKAEKTFTGCRKCNNHFNQRLIGHVISSKAIATGKEEVLCPHSQQFSLLNRGLPLGGGGGGVSGLGSSGAAASHTSPDLEQARLSEQLKSQD